MDKKNKFITHSGSFHADDVFACATLMILLDKRGEGYEVTRTREPEIIAAGDFVFDVGGIHDESINRFDHHQPGGAGKRDNGIEYASFGLVWKKYGTEVAGSHEAAKKIDQKLAQVIDAGDNGISISKNLFEDASPYEFHNIIHAFLPTWREDTDKDALFLELVTFGKKILEREIVKAKSAEDDRKKVLEAYDAAEDKRIIILDERYSWGDTLSEFPEPLFVIQPREDGAWNIAAIRKEKDSFKNRKDLPAAWGGLTGSQLAQATGVSDAVFCHRALFLAGAKSREGALKMVQTVVE